MKSYYLLSIPVVIGIIGGIALFYATAIEDSHSNDEKLTAQKLIENGSPIMGSLSAPITILEWGDYQCTFCYRFHQSSLNIIQNDYIKTGKVNLVFKDFPLNGPDSVLAAEASHCAMDQGKFWQYHDELYDNWEGERTGWVNRNSLNQFAQQVGLDLEEFNRCLDSHKYQQKVLELEQFGKDIGIRATPTFLIFNDEKVVKIEGNQPIEVFQKVIDGFNQN